MKSPWPIAGTKSGRLAAVAPVPGAVRGRRKWTWLCDCGNSRVAYVSHVKSGLTSSCGCARGTHRHSATGTYRSWCSMIQRCTNQENPNYKNYGARGIKICERWRDFATFLADVGHRPSPAHTLERDKNDGNYEPGNVRWATRAEQLRNTRRTVRVRTNGRDICLKDAAKEVGVSYGAVVVRRLKGEVGSDLFRPSQREKLAWNGRTVTVKQLAIESGLAPSTVGSRLARGWSLPEALSVSPLSAPPRR
jgi:hypothetical protein